jgi:hypothetical protein
METRYSSLLGGAARGYEARTAASAPGFTALEVVAGVAVVAALAAVTVPNVAVYLDERKVDSTSTLLAELKDGLTSPSAGFRRSVGANAGRLSELTSQIWNGGAGAAFPLNSCGQPFSNAEVSNWDDAGPFVGFFIPSSGLPTPIGLVSDRLVRVPEKGDSATLRVEIHGVKLGHATMLDRKTDGANGSEQGAIRWSAPQSEAVTVQYLVPVDGRC